jgi:hypothetical protein
MSGYKSPLFYICVAHQDAHPLVMYYIPLNIRTQQFYRKLLAIHTLKVPKKQNSCMQIQDYVSVRNLVKKGSKFRAMSCILSSIEVCQFLMAQLISITCHIILSCLHGGLIHITNMSKTLKR